MRKLGEVASSKSPPVLVGFFQNSKLLALRGARPAGSPAEPPGRRPLKGRRPGFSMGGHLKLSALAPLFDARPLKMT